MQLDQVGMRLKDGPHILTARRKQHNVRRCILTPNVPHLTADDRLRRADHLRNVTGKGMLQPLKLTPVAAICIDFEVSHGHPTWLVLHPYIFAYH
jgi:hypothetical protein